LSEAGRYKLNSPSFSGTELQRTEEVDFLQNLVVGMLTRIQEVIVRDGGMTRY